MLSTLFTCGGMRQGNHHLYDDIDRNKVDKYVIGDAATYDEDFD